jgi:hypothetical protein
MNPLQEYLSEYSGPPMTEREAKLAAAIEKKAAMVKESFTGLGKAIQMGVKGGGGVIGQGLIQTGKETAKQTAKQTAKALSKRVGRPQSWVKSQPAKVKVPQKPAVKPKPAVKEPAPSSTAQSAPAQQSQVSKAVNPQQQPMNMQDAMRAMGGKPPAAAAGPAAAPHKPPAGMQDMTKAMGGGKGPATATAAPAQTNFDEVFKANKDMAAVAKGNPELGAMLKADSQVVSPKQFGEHLTGLGDAGKQYTVLQQHHANLTAKMGAGGLNPAAEQTIKNALTETGQMMKQVQTGNPLGKGLLGGFGGASPTSDIVKKLRWPAAGVGAVYLGSQAMGGGQQYAPQGY